jgi:hypothetical protein
MGSLKRRQQGMGFWGLVLVLVALGMVVLVGLKLFPVYMEAFKVDSALEKIIKQDDVRTTPRQDIYKAFIRYMTIEDVDRFSERNIRDYMKVEKRNDEVTVTVSYQARTNLFSNLSIVADWEKVVSTAP